MVLRAGQTLLLLHTLVRIKIISQLLGRKSMQTDPLQISTDLGYRDQFISDNTIHNRHNSPTTKSITFDITAQAGIYFYGNPPLFDDLQRSGFANQRTTCITSHHHQRRSSSKVANCVFALATRSRFRFCARVSM